MKYEEPGHYSRIEALSAVSGGSVEEACTAIISVCLQESDCAWAELFCLQNTGDIRREVVAASITGLGHIARIHGKLSPASIARLNSLSTNPEWAGIVGDALDDLAIFGKRGEIRTRFD